MPSALECPHNTRGASSRSTDSSYRLAFAWATLKAASSISRVLLKDKFGLSWQIVPTVMYEMQKTKDKKKLARVTEAFLQMKKFDIAALQRAYDAT